MKKFSGNMVTSKEAWAEMQKMKETEEMMKGYRVYNIVVFYIIKLNIIQQECILSQFFHLFFISQKNICHYFITEMSLIGSSKRKPTTGARFLDSRKGDISHRSNVVYIRRNMSRNFNLFTVTKKSKVTFLAFTMD